MHSGSLHLSAWLLALLLPLTVTACESPLPGDGSRSAMSEDSFVDAMVALRRAALGEESGRLPPEDAREVLAEQGTTEEELRRFVEIRGGNAPAMSAVWTRIEARLTGQDPEDLELDSADLDTLPGAEPGMPPPGTLPGGGDAPDGPPGPGIREPGS